MATGRTTIKNYRMYVGGYDLSGFGRDIGPIGVEVEEVDLTTWTDPVKGYLKNRAQVGIGTLNAVFDNTATTGIHALMGTAGIKRDVLIALGIQAAPTAGDPAFMGQFAQSGYQEVDNGGAMTVTVPFEGWDATANSMLYAPGWGILLHPNAAETAVNTAVGFDNPTGGQTLNGGLMVYQVLTSSNPSHTATLKVQDAATNTNPSFADLSGATTGVITVTAGVSGLVALPTTGAGATVRQFLRWQIVLGTATSVTFLIGFVRG
jgi:hypothetical protein